VKEQSTSNGANGLEHKPAALSLIVAFLALTVVVIAYPVNIIDIRFSRFLQTADWAIVFKTTNAFFNEITLRILCLILIIYSMARKRYGMAILFGVSTIIEIVSFLIKLAIQRPRPTTDFIIEAGKSGGFSYISSHTFEYSFFFWMLAAIVAHSGFLSLSKSLRYSAVTILSIIPIAIGLGRIYLGEHWLTDVIGSYLLAGCIVTYAMTLLPRVIYRYAPKTGR
jgi:membrane-associated phospholipid phosphatase